VSDLSCLMGKYVGDPNESGFAIAGGVAATALYV
jgi:hypothetical protein